MKEGHLWLDHNLVEVTVVVLLEIGETWSSPHPGRGTAELFFRCQQCDDETREILDRVEALDGEEGLEPEVAIVTEKPDPKRELVRAFYGIHFWGSGVGAFQGLRNLSNTLGPSRWVAWAINSDLSKVVCCWLTPAQKQGVAKIVGDAESEPVVVEENSIEILIEELRGDKAFELVEAEIQRLLGIGLGLISWQNRSVTQ
ncbi:hypothetical protein ACFX13_003634 [Malus domestica]